MFKLIVTFFLIVFQSKGGAGANSSPSLVLTPMTQPLFTCKNPTRINVFGDLAIGPNHRDKAKNYFQKIEGLLRSADFNIVNLEGSLSDEKKRAFPDNRFAILIDNSIPDLLKSFNISYVTRANNHAMDYGEEGRVATDKELSKANITWTGIGKDLNEASAPIVIRHERKSIAFFALTTTYPLEAWATSKKAGVASLRIENMAKVIEEAKQKYDFVVVIYHWGEELVKTPLPHQIYNAKQAVLAGADAIIGHHAHIPQQIDVYKEKTISYGLGNFIFTAGSSKPTLGLVEQLEFCIDNNAKKLNTQFIPINTSILHTHFVVNPYTIYQFKKESKDYINGDIFHQQILFRFLNQKEAVSAHYLKALEEGVVPMDVAHK
jgi:poly-gamma-glutamate capsule biosynthesis protein CapA/YwtB (metallophosphatase superfamily)